MARIPHLSRSGLALAVLLAGLLPSAAAAGPGMSTVVFGLPISFEECRGRVAKALAAEGFGDTRDFGNGWLGFTASESASVGCIHGNNETVVNVVVAGGGDTTRSRDRLAALIRESRGPAESAHLGVSVSANGEVTVQWKDTPGNAQDWMAVQPVGAPDDAYGSTWTYTEGKRSGSKSFGRLAPGEYEVRLYHDWPNGGFTVQERLRFRIAG